MISTTPDTDQLYVDTIQAMPDHRDRDRFRNLVYELMRGKNMQSYLLDYDTRWTEVVVAAVASSKTWVSARERAEIIAKIEAGNDEYEEAIASQEAAATIPI